jgi:hypothetical protein
MVTGKKPVASQQQHVEFRQNFFPWPANNNISRVSAKN